MYVIKLIQILNKSKMQSVSETVLEIILGNHHHWDIEN